MQETFASYDEMGRRSGGEQRLKILRTQIARRVPPISLQVDAPIIREDDTFLLQHLAHHARTAKRMAPSQLAFAIDDALRRNSFHCFTHDPAYHTRTTWIAKRPGNPAIGCHRISPSLVGKDSRKHQASVHDDFIGEAGSFCTSPNNFLLTW